MAWSESKAWRTGTANQPFYQALLDDAAAAPARNARRRKVIHPEDMPWEMSRQGLLKHLVNEAMNTRMETVDAYMQIIPPGSRSGKHRGEIGYVTSQGGFVKGQEALVIARQARQLRKVALKGILVSKGAREAVAAASNPSPA